MRGAQWHSRVANHWKTSDGNSQKKKTCPQPMHACTLIIIACRFGQIYRLAMRVANHLKTTNGNSQKKIFPEPMHACTMMWLLVDRFGQIIRLAMRGTQWSNLGHCIITNSTSRSWLFLLFLWPWHCQSSLDNLSNLSTKKLFIKKQICNGVLKNQEAFEQVPSSIGLRFVQVYGTTGASYGAPSSGYGAPSSSYGAPSSSYGSRSNYDYPVVSLFTFFLPSKTLLIGLDSILLYVVWHFNIFSRWVELRNVTLYLKNNFQSWKLFHRRTCTRSIKQIKIQMPIKIQIQKTIAQEDGYEEYRALVDSQRLHPAGPHKNELTKRIEEVGIANTLHIQKKIHIQIQIQIKTKTQIQIQTRF